MTGEKSRSEAKFEKIYAENVWGNSESLSGPGSTLVATENLRQALPVLLADLNVRCLLDAPCGDLNWIAKVLEELNIFYIGVDIVEPLIAKLRRLYRDDKKKCFLHIDVTIDMLPMADLLIARDFLFHLSYQDTANFLANYLSSRIPFLLTTTHVNNGRFENRDIETGRWRWFDIFSEPYSFSAYPLRQIPDDGGVKSMCLFTRYQVKGALKSLNHHLSSIDSAHGGSGKSRLFVE